MFYIHVIIKIKLFTKNRLGKTQSVVVIYLQQSLYFGGVFILYNETWLFKHPCAWAREKNMCTFKNL